MDANGAVLARKIYTPSFRSNAIHTGSGSSSSDRQQHSKTFPSICGSSVFISTYIVGLLCLSLVACERLNTNLPEYIKDVVVYKEGSDGLVVYFVLADASGAMTTADGEVSLVILQERNQYSRETGRMETQSTTLLLRTFNITKSDFRKTTVGQGTFQHTAILCSMGRIRYSDFEATPSDDPLASWSVYVTFKPKEYLAKGYPAMQGKTTITF